MIALTCFVYLLITTFHKVTPIFSLLKWLNNLLYPIGKWIQNLIRKKPSAEIIEDAFTVPVKSNAANTFAEKIADKGGDGMAEMIKELGKYFVNVDKRVKIFFILLLNVFFVTGMVQHIMWAIHYWQITAVAVTLFIEFSSFVKTKVVKK